MNKKSGKAGSPVSPIAPGAAHEADRADPGEVDEIKAEQIKTKTGKYGATKAKPFQPEETSTPGQTGASGGNGLQTSTGGGTDTKKKSWIEIELVGEDAKPIPGERYRITLPDGTAAEGALDHKGFARVAGFTPGTCKITFPDLDQEAWEEL